MRTCFSSHGKAIQDRSFYWPGLFGILGKAAISDEQSQLGNTVLVASRGNQCCQQWLWSSQKVEMQRISQESINQQLISQHCQWYLVLKKYWKSTMGCYKFLSYEFFSVKKKYAEHWRTWKWKIVEKVTNAYIQLLQAKSISRCPLIK